MLHAAIVRLGKSTRYAWLALLLAGWSACSHAEMTTYSDTVLVRGEYYLGVFPLPFDAPGSYSITATDLHWMDEPLDALSFGAFSATGPLGTRQGAGTLEFYKAGSDPVYLLLFASTSGPHYAGLVGIEGRSVVPLPASALLLGSGFAALLLVLRRRAIGAGREGAAPKVPEGFVPTDICNTSAMFV